MQFFEIVPPRQFEAGSPPQQVVHTADVVLEPGEQVTFHCPSGAQFDLVAREWGFYATPSINARLASFGLETALVRHVESEKKYILVVEGSQQETFMKYLEEQGLEVVDWLSS